MFLLKSLYLLKQPRTRTAAGDGAFVIAAPRLWNCLPVDIRRITTISLFKKDLKNTCLNKDTNSSYDRLQ